jgi:hypothetical protein
MNDFLFTAFKFLSLAIVSLGLTLGTCLLTNRKDTLEKIFPKQKPEIKIASLSFKKTDESEKITIYHLARLLAICVMAFFLTIIFTVILKI